MFSLDEDPLILYVPPLLRPRRLPNRKFLLYNPQCRLSERITSPHPFRVRSPLPPFTRTLAPRSLDTRPPLLPPRKLRFEISHFRALCRPSPSKAAKMAMCPHMRAHPNRWSIHRWAHRVTWQAGWIMQRNVVARSHTDGTQLAGSWRAPTQDLARANSSVGARQVLSWLAPSSKLARQFPIWRAPTPLLAHTKSEFGARTYHLARAKTMPSQCLLISSTACCPDSDSPRSLPPACAWGQAGAQPGACPAGPSAP